MNVEILTLQVVSSMISFMTKNNFIHTKPPFYLGSHLTRHIVLECTLTMAVVSFSIHMGKHIIKIYCAADVSRGREEWRCWSFSISYKSVFYLFILMGAVYLMRTIGARLYSC